MSVGAPPFGWTTAVFGLAATGVLAIVAIAWLNIRQADRRTDGVPDGLDTWWVYVATGLVVALPMLAAGLLIHRRRA